MPTQIKVPTNQPFAHGGYLDMTWLDAFRSLGMKNPGFARNTFVAELHPDGVSFHYETADATEEVAAEPTDDTSIQPDEAITGKGRTRKNRKARKTRKIRILI